PRSTNAANTFPGWHFTTRATPGVYQLVLDDLPIKRVLMGSASRRHEAYRKVCPAPRHVGHAHLESRRACTSAWLRHLSAHSPNIQRSPAGPAGFALSRAAPAGETRLASRGLGRVGKRPASEIL